MEEIVTRINTRVPDEIQAPLTKAINTLFAGNNSALVIKWITDRLEQEGYLHQHRIEDQAIKEAKAALEVIGPDRLLQILREARQAAFVEEAEVVG